MPSPPSRSYRHLVFINFFSWYRDAVNAAKRLFRSFQTCSVIQSSPPKNTEKRKKYSRRRALCVCPSEWKEKGQVGVSREREKTHTHQLRQLYWCREEKQNITTLLTKSLTKYVYRDNGISPSTAVCLQYSRSPTVMKLSIANMCFKILISRETFKKIEVFKHMWWLYVFLRPPACNWTYQVASYVGIDRDQKRGIFSAQIPAALVQYYYESAVLPVSLNYHSDNI